MDAAGAVRGLVSCNDSLGVSGDVAQRHAMRPRRCKVWTAARRRHGSVSPICNALPPLRCR